MSKSISDHFNANDSPILKPTVRERTCNASNLSPLVAARNVRACSASSGVISSYRTFGGSTLAAGLNGIRLNLTACSNARLSPLVSSIHLGEALEGPAED